MRTFNKIVCSIVFLLAVIVNLTISKRTGPVEYLVTGFSDESIEQLYFDKKAVEITIAGHIILIKGICNRIAVSITQFEPNNTPGVDSTLRQCSVDEMAIENSIVRASIHFLSVEIFERESINDIYGVSKMLDGDNKVYLMEDKSENLKMEGKKIDPSFYGYKKF